MSLLIDTTLYDIWAPETEEDFEKVVKPHMNDIFGEKTLFFDVKTKLETKMGKGVVPDGFLINLSSPSLNIIEFELSYHSAWDHLVPQILRFNEAIKHFETQKKIIDLIYDNIINDSSYNNKIKKYIGSGDIHHFISSLFNRDINYVIIIEQINDTHNEVLKSLPSKTKIMEFKTYYNKNHGVEKNVHLFEPLYNRFESNLFIKQDTNLIDKKLRYLVRGFKTNKVNRGFMWRGFNSEIQSKYKIKGIELVKHKNENKVILLAYLNDLLLKPYLQQIGYNEWYSDNSKGDYSLHSLSDESKTHVLLLKTTFEEIEYEKVKGTVYKLMNDIQTLS